MNNFKKPLNKDIPDPQTEQKDYLDDSWQAEKGFFHEITSEGGLPKNEKENDEEGAEK